MSDSKKLYAVAGVTGNTGAAAADALLERGAGVRVIVRDPQKGEKWAARGAEIAVADLGSAHALTDALTGTDGAYLLSPPDFNTDDFLANLNFTESDYQWVSEQIVAVADKYSEGRIVSSLEGGYQVEALARSVEIHIKSLFSE